MYTFEILKEEEYEAFQSQHEYANFLNSVEAGKLREFEGWDVEYVGVKEGGKVVAATILASIPVMKVFKYFNAQRGLLLDYANLELLSFFTSELKKYLKEKKALYLMCNPHIIYETRNNEGELVSNENMNYIIENMMKVGFIHSGFQEEYNANSEVQWEYSLYLNGMNEKELLDHVSSRTRYTINKTLKQKLKIRTLNKDEMDIFFEILKNTADRRGFEELLRDDSHYLNMLDFYGEHIRVYLSYLNSKETLDGAINDKKMIEEKLVAVEEEINKRGNSKRFLNQKKELEIELTAKDKIIAEMNELSKEYGEEIPLSTGMFIDYPYEMSYMYSGSMEDKRLRKYDGPYAIQYETLKYAIEHHIDHYNFYGIKGDFSSEGNDGVFEYKKGFNGVAEKIVGEFVLPIKQAAYTLYKKIKKR